MNQLVKLIFFFLLLAISVIGVAQDKSCVLCENSAGKQPGSVVYQDSSVVSFLAHAPDNAGHLHVAPNQHARYYTDIPDATLANMTHVAGYLIKLIKSIDIKAEEFQLLLN